jgi:hypothetical protein
MLRTWAADARMTVVGGVSDPMWPVPPVNRVVGI